MGPAQQILSAVPALLDVVLTRSHQMVRPCKDNISAVRGIQPVRIDVCQSCAADFIVGYGKIRLSVVSCKKATGRAPI